MKREIKLKGSFTLEAAIWVPMLLLIYATVIKTGINLYVEVREQKECEAQKDMWMVDDFYKYQLVKEVVHGK